MTRAEAHLRAFLHLVPADHLVYRRSGRGALDGPGWYLTRFGQSTRWLGACAADIIGPTRERR